MTPFMREAMRSTIAGFEGFLDLTSIAVLETTVSIALRPAAFIVSPDSVCFSLRASCLVGCPYQLDPLCHLRRLKHRLLQHFHSAQ